MWAVPLGTPAQLSKLAAGNVANWDSAAVGSSPWGALYTAGDTGHGINSLHEWGRWIYIGKPDGLFEGDEDGNLWNRIPEVIESSNNCLRLGRWQGFLWAPSIIGLFRYTGMAARTQGPEVVGTNASAIRGGYFTALAKAGHWLYGAYKAQDNKTYILTARLRESGEGGPGELIWHTIDAGFATTDTVSDMLVSTVPSPPCLFITLSAGTNADDIHYIILNKDGSLNTNDSGYSSIGATTQSIYLSRIDLDSPGTTKLGHFIEVHTSGTVAAAKWVKVYAAWDDGSFNQVGSTIVASGFTRLAWTAGSNDTGRSLQIRVDMQSDASDARPVLDKLTVNLIESPRPEPAIRTSVRIADNLDKKRPATQMETDIKALGAGSVYDLVDPDDPAAGTVKVKVHEYEFVETEQEGALQGERQCNLTLRVVQYT